MNRPEHRIVIHGQSQSSLERANDFRDAVVDGLTAVAKSLPCRFIYDENGSRLFAEITELDEYYLTRAEDEILRTYADEIVAPYDSGFVIAELGSGDAAKTRHLFEAAFRRFDRLGYIPIDISREFLEASANKLVSAYPRLDVVGIAAEYEAALTRLGSLKRGSLLLLFLGSSIGNFDYDEAAQFLSRCAALLKDCDRFLIGFDLRKDKAVLEAAYDDARGVTARFNKNLLVRINRELGGDFDVDSFRHIAEYDEDTGIVSSHLESIKEQAVHLAAVDQSIAFAAGERIHTEDSFKYAPGEIEALLAAAGLVPDKHWLDSKGRFCLQQARRV